MVIHDEISLIQKKHQNQTPHIMVVDDEPQVGEVILRHLSSLGYKVETYTHPIEALSHIKRGDYDVIIVDINMPELGGLEFLKKVKKELDSSIEVIVISARGTLTELTQALRLGASDYLRKPFNLNQIDTAVNRALSIRYLKLQNEEYRKRLESKLETLQEANRKERAARKALEYLTQTMISLNEELALSNLQLEKANRLILEANQHKSEFLARMSHELRTPLNSIIGFSELLYNEMVGPLNPKQKQYLENILESSRHLLALINDILDISKIEAGEMELVWDMLYVPNLLEECAKLLYGMAQKKKIQIHIQEAPDLEVPGDSQRLKQIFFNLISNAIKFSPEKSSVEIGAQDHGEEILFWVKDYGPGIPEAFRDRIFKKFQQLDTTLARQHEGTGLGLALTKNLVEMHGGKIWFETEVGKGTTFFFTLPKTPRPQKVSSDEESSHSVKIKTPEVVEILKKISPPKIYVNPQEEDLQMVINCLHDMGYMVGMKNAVGKGASSNWEKPYEKDEKANHKDEKSQKDLDAPSSMPKIEGEREE